MAKTETIQARINPKVKKEVQGIPNNLTAEVLKESESGTNLHKAKDVDALMRELEK